MNRKRPLKQFEDGPLLTRHDRAVHQGERYETVWRRDQAGDGPKLIKIGNRELCRPSDYAKWLESQEVKRP